MEAERKTYAVRVDNLTDKITVEELIKEFKSWGPIHDATIQQSNGRRKIGFINFYSKEVAEVAANNMDNTFISGTRIKTSFKYDSQAAKDKRVDNGTLRATELLVENLPFEKKFEQMVKSRLHILSYDYEGCVGEIHRDNHTATAWCMISFKSADNADRARRKMHGAWVCGRELWVKGHLQSVVAEMPIQQPSKAMKRKKVASMSSIYPRIKAIQGGATLADKVQEILREFPHYLPLDVLLDEYFKVHNEDFDVLQLSERSNNVIVDGKPGRIFVCLRGSSISQVRIQCKKAAFHGKLLSVLTMHKHGVPLEILPGLMWSYKNTVLKQDPSGIPLHELVSTCQDVKSLHSRIFLRKRPYDIRQNADQFIADIIEMLSLSINWEVRINRFAFVYERVFGTKVYGIADLEKVISEIVTGIIEIIPRYGNRFLTIEASKRNEILGKNLEKLLLGEEKQRIPINTLSAKYYKFYGSKIPNYDNFNHPIALIRDLGRKSFSLFREENETFCGLKKGQTLIKFKRGLISLLRSRDGNKVLYQNVEHEYETFHGSFPKLKNLGFDDLNDLLALMEPDIVVKKIRSDNFIVLCRNTTMNLWDDVLETMLESSEKAVLLCSLPQEIQDRKDALFSSVPAFVKVLGFGESACFILNSKYEELVADDIVTHICKLLYRSPGFKQSKQEILDRLSGEREQKLIALEWVLNNKLLSVQDDVLTLNQNVVLQYFTYEVISLLFEQPENSCSLAAFSGLYQKKFGRHYKVADFGFKKSLTIFNTIGESKVLISKPTLFDKSPILSLASNGQFIEEAKKVLTDSNGLVFLNDLMEIYNGIVNDSAPNYYMLLSIVESCPELFATLELKSTKATHNLVLLKLFHSSLEFFVDDEMLWETILNKEPTPLTVSVSLDDISDSGFGSQPPSEFVSVLLDDISDSGFGSQPPSEFGSVLLDDISDSGFGSQPPISVLLDDISDSGFGSQPPSEFASCYEPSRLEGSGDDNDDSIVIVIDSEGGFFRCDALNLSLTVPANSVDRKVQLKISSTNTSNVPPVSCDFGEMVLSNAILLEPIGLEFGKPAVLSIDHSIIELPKLSSIVIKCYDHENKEWMTLPTGTGRAKQELRVASGEISRASIFAVCLSLDLDTCTVTKDGLSFAPFGSQYRVKVTFDENTFDEDNAILNFKMNIFSKTAVDEFLSRFGLKPFPILHVKEKTKKQPLKPITIKLPIDGQIQSDEKVVVLCADSDRITDVKEVTSYKVGKNFLTIHLDHFTILSAFVQRVGKHFNFSQVFQWLWPYAGTRHSVEFMTYCKLIPSPEETFYVGCCEQHKLEDLRKLMDQLHCVAINASQGELYSNTEMTIKVDGIHQIIHELKFINNNCNHTDEIRITVNEGSSRVSEFMIFKVGDDNPFKRIKFRMTEVEGLRNFVNAGRARREDANALHIHNSAVAIGDNQRIACVSSHQLPGGRINALTPAPSAAHVEAATGSANQLQRPPLLCIPDPFEATDTDQSE